MGRARGLEILCGEMGVESVPPASQAAEHRVGRFDEFDQQQIGSKLGCEIKNLFERHTLRYQHVMDHGEHYQHVKSATGPIEERWRFAIAPAESRRRAAKIHHKGKNIEALPRSPQPDASHGGRVGIDRDYARTAASGQFAEVSRVRAYIEYAPGSKFTECRCNKRFLGGELVRSVVPLRI